ncbi:hypothetical protein Q4Q35_19550 [Flavivirga aquimarina]|uniref:ATP-grasp domain-containing protein n=1 Tax=Flavivirga aquimarina TaxID=2027862 RepID=A0ABT8WFR2_9FLAO|nr:hypothetical protein [Flavivirga aquimarina]MDO5972002.1 hypothetical protein [Flavivirga aquimarina]
MDYFLIGCPYTKMKHLRRAFETNSYPDISIINIENIGKIDKKFIYLKNTNIKVKLSDIKSCHIRYPYDLIPPLTATFKRREETEFIKTICLLFDEVSVNSFTASWVFRNRAFSLLTAEKYDCKIADFEIIKEDKYSKIKSLKAIKALGNCFVSEDLKPTKTLFSKYIEIAQDGEDVAVIFPASKFDNKMLSEYIKVNGIAFIQNIVNSINEYRTYIIGKNIFIYKRGKHDSFDKSPAEYIKSDYKCSETTEVGLKNMMSDYNLNYLCFDMIVNSDGSEFIIDINPFGGLPNFEVFPEPSMALFNLMLKSVYSD